MHDPADYELEIHKAAARFSVRHPIHIDDFIFQYLLDHPDFKTRYVAVDHYFENGRESALRFDELVSRFKPSEGPLDVLEFASGYGCVSRHLVAMNEKYKIHACDIHENAVAFLRDKLGVNASISDRVPEMLSLNRDFPVIFALSFFSHMPDATWGRWLVKLIDLLADKGILVFTTHGLKTARDVICTDIDESGYWFRLVSEQTDLATEEYGTTIVTPKYALNKIFACKNANLLFFQEGLWWGHQDTYIVQKWKA